MRTDLYSAFEERFRGSRVMVKSRMEVYLPFIVPILSIYPTAKAVDLGCGRGEWLELLKENGFLAYGVDLNEAMLEPAKALGLEVYREEVIHHLKKLADNSMIVVSAFHIVEHIPFADVEMLLQEAMRVLVPGGILIIETPNPENIVVGTSNFYLDPTHKSPIPPQLLGFLPEYYGFSQFKILRLQEETRLTSQYPLGLIDVLRGVSPDCSIVAQKGADEKILSLNKQAFAKDYGVTLEQLAANYDRQNAKVLSNIEQFIHFFGHSEAALAEQDNLFDKLLMVMQESESNRTNLLQQIDTLSSILKESEFDRLQRTKQIDELTVLLKASESHRIELVGQIDTLSSILKESEFDRLQRAKQIEELTALLKESLAQRAECTLEIQELASETQRLGANNLNGEK